MITTLYIDMDGVLCNFVKGFLDKYDLQKNIEDMEQYYIEKYFNLNFKQMSKLIDCYDLFFDLEKMPNADAIVYNGSILFDRCAILTYGMSGNAIQAKTDWCKKYYPTIPVICTEHKETLCRDEYDILIDDHDKHIYKWTSKGGNAILYPHPWNKKREESKLHEQTILDRIINEMRKTKRSLT